MSGKSKIHRVAKGTAAWEPSAGGEPPDRTAVERALQQLGLSGLPVQPGSALAKLGVPPGSVVLDTPGAAQRTEAELLAQLRAGGSLEVVDARGYAEYRAASTHPSLALAPRTASGAFLLPGLGPGTDGLPEGVRILTVQGQGAHSPVAVADSEALRTAAAAEQHEGGALSLRLVKGGGAGGGGTPEELALRWTPEGWRTAHPSSAAVGKVPASPAQALEDRIRNDLTLAGAKLGRPIRGQDGELRYPVLQVPAHSRAARLHLAKDDVVIQRGDTLSLLRAKSGRGSEASTPLALPAALRDEARELLGRLDGAVIPKGAPSGLTPGTVVLAIGSESGPKPVTTEELSQALSGAKGRCTLLVLAESGLDTFVLDGDRAQRRAAKGLRLGSAVEPFKELAQLRGEIGHGVQLTSLDAVDYSGNMRGARIDEQGLEQVVQAFSAAVDAEQSLLGSAHGLSRGDFFELLKSVFPQTFNGHSFRSSPAADDFALPWDALSLRLDDILAQGKGLQMDPRQLGSVLKAVASQFVMNPDAEPIYVLPEAGAAAASQAPAPDYAKIDAMMSDLRSLVEQLSREAPNDPLHRARLAQLTLRPAFLSSNQVSPEPGSKGPSDADRRALRELASATLEALREVKDQNKPLPQRLELMNQLLSNDLQGREQLRSPESYTGVPSWKDELERLVATEAEPEVLEPVEDYLASYVALEARLRTLKKQGGFEVGTSDRSWIYDHGAFTE